MLNSPYSSAVADFRRLRSRADLSELISRLTGEPNQLLSYHEVVQKLRLQGSAERGLRDIPLDAIVGSVGRYSDFTRDFLPLRDTDRDRWARVKVLASGMVGFPPIEVYKIGDAYFVKDGNHRVSVARDLGATHIQAYVTEVQTRVPLTPDIKPDDLILLSEYGDFLEATQLDKTRPEANIRVTIPGKYPELLEHIAVHQYYMGIDFQRPFSFPEAAAHWYDTVYLPVVKLIKELGILRDFPGRTEADLYLWLAKHRAQLEEELGWQIKNEYALADLADQAGMQTSFWESVGKRLVSLIIPDALEAGPPPGEWRMQVMAGRNQEQLAEVNLFGEILVPVDGKDGGWFALEQALIVAQREGSRLHGIFVVPGESDLTTPATLAVQEQFEGRCQQAGISGKLTPTVGNIVPQLCTHVRWNDLMVINVSYPPPEQPLARLSSGFRELIQRCSRPILATPRTTSPLNSALLAYDASPKAEEALFVATYLAARWKIRLVVASVVDGRSTDEKVLERARNYLEEHGVQAEYRLERGEVAEVLIQLQQEAQVDFLIMGGYRLHPALELVLGSTLDETLRESCKPVMICR